MSGDLLGLLMDSAVRATVAAILVGAVLVVFRIRASAARHAAWTLVLMSMLLMPAMTRWLPGIAVAVPNLAPVSLLSTVASTDNRFTFPDPVEEGRAAIGPLTYQAAVETPSPPPLMRRPAWPALGAAAYIVVALILFVRLLTGWRRARQIVRLAHPATPDGTAAILESPLVGAPVTIGVLRPRIVLPNDWRRWSAEHLRAVLAHEGAHVRRRDPLVVFAAHLNRCMFWFHPLSWWLARQLTITAEQACDEEGVRAVGEPRRYAAVLLDTALAVRRGYGRLIRQGVGMDGGGLLVRRIDRVLGGSFEPDSSPLRKRVAASGCVLAIVLVVGCRPQAMPYADNPQQEQQDRRLKAHLEEMDRAQFVSVADIDWDTTAEQIARLEAAVDASPHDLDRLRQLLIAYWTQFSPARDAPADPAIVVRRRPRILRLIDEHPESPLAGAIEARLFPAALDPSFPFDAEGYQAARSRWEVLGNRADASVAVLGNASYFFESADPRLAESFLRRAAVLDPGGPWRARLGRLYAVSLTGLYASAGRNRARRVIIQSAANDSRSVMFRKALGESTDAEVLTAAGFFLMHSTRGPFMSFDPDVWAEACLSRALNLNPDAVLAHSWLLNVFDRQEQRRPRLWSDPPAAQYHAFSMLPEAERFERLGRIGFGGPWTLDQDRWNDPNLREYFSLKRDNARRFAGDALTLASKRRTHPKYGTVVYAAHMTLASLAATNGDTSGAVEHLRQAARAPASEDLAYREGIAAGFRWPALRQLLKSGEGTAVAEFLEQMARVNLPDRIELRSAAAAIRRGETPPL